MTGYIFCAYFKQFSLSSPDVNKNKGVAETAPLMVMLHGTTVTTIFRATSTSTPKRFANVASFWSPSKKRPTCCTQTRPAVLREMLSLQFLLPCNIMNKLWVRWKSNNRERSETWLDHLNFHQFGEFQVTEKNISATKKTVCMIAVLDKQLWKCEKDCD